MAIEDDLKALTTAINRIAAKLPDVGSENSTTAHQAATASVAAAAPATPARGPGRPRKITLDEVRAVANKLRAEKGQPVAVKLISEHGANQLADMDESKYSSFIAAADLLLRKPHETADSDL